MNELDFNDDFDAEEMTALADVERKAQREDPAALAAIDPAEREAARVPSVRETLPKVCLHPEWWCPPLLQAKPKRTEIDPLYKAYRADNRPYRRAFGRGERSRKILLACAQAKLKEMD